MKSDELFALLRRRGVIWPSAEIYGGAQGLYDYGPLGASLKRRLEDAWAAWFLGLSDDYYLVEASEILPESVVRASGHLENFTDPQVTCGNCHSAFRADTLLEKVRPQGVDGLSAEEIGAIVRTSGARCPRCGSTDLSVPVPFQLMFGIDFGAKGGERAYLRPETAQSSYLAFDRMTEVGRKALPLGIAGIGKAYRNEIAPRQHLFRMRAFTQAELQIFFDPNGFPVPFGSVADRTLPILRADRREAGAESVEPRTARELVDHGRLPEFFVYHLVQSHRFFTEVLRYPEASIRFFEKSSKERAFYNRLQFDIEVHLPSLGGFRELGAVHYRGDWDLTRHGTGRGKPLDLPAPGGGRLVPHVLEITFGVDRNIWALADLGLRGEGERRVWSLPPYLAPVTIGVFPLLKKEHTAAALDLLEVLRDEGVRAEFDDAGAIGRRYARSDEAGVPFCATADGETVAADGPGRGTYTLRDRDSRLQERLTAPQILARLRSAVRFPRPLARTFVGPAPPVAPSAD